MTSATASYPVIDDTSLEVINETDDASLLIVRTPHGRLELWERVVDYRGETVVFKDATYRFLRTWKGARNRT